MNFMISPDETEITGKWLMSQGRVVADEVCQRILDLTNEYMFKLGCDPSGWNALYRDPIDGRLWELVYPKSELHGGGPPQLRCISISDAKEKYGVEVQI
jgi:hypothetical protein